MRKLTKMLLSVFFVLTLVLSVSLSAGLFFAEAEEANAETSIEFVQHRDTCNRLLIKLTTSDYASVGATTAAQGDISADGVTMLDKTLVYLDDNTYVTLRAATKEGTEVYYNVWGETGTICLDTKADFGRGKIKYLTFLEG